METCEAILDKCQEFLHDEEAIWTRAELLRWLNDGYRVLVADSRSVKRFFIFDVPPRVTFAGSFEWEDRHGPGTWRKFTKSALSGSVECTFQWEVEFLEGLTPTNSNNAVTYLWELAYIGSDIDNHYRFALPRSNDRIHRVAFDDKKLLSGSVKEIDLQNTPWWQDGSEPAFWLRGLGRENTFEVYEIETTYNQQYAISDEPFGLPRGFSGSRSYEVESTTLNNDYAYTNAEDSGAYSPGLGWRFTQEATDTDKTNCVFGWEKEMLEGETTFTDSETVSTYAWEAEEFAGQDQIYFGVGALRHILSPDRQYLPQPYDTGELEVVGAARDFKSSVDSISVLESIVHTRELQEDDSPALIPEKMFKYLRYYVLAMAFMREGEGQRADLAGIYLGRFKRGALLMTVFTKLTSGDRSYQREGEPSRAGRPPRPRLPSTFPRSDYYA